MSSPDTNGSVSTDGQEQVPSVGDEIRAARKARHLTLKELSARTGRSVAYLSRIERGGANISVALLTAIGEALNVDPKWFFPSRGGTSFNERAYVVRAHSRRSMSSLYTRRPEELGFYDELLSSSIAGQFYIVWSRYPPGVGAEPDDAEGFVYEGEHHGVVIQGAVELTLGDDKIVLNTGDSFSCPAEIPHRFRNASEHEALMVWAMAPVLISW